MLSCFCIWKNDIVTWVLWIFIERISWWLGIYRLLGNFVVTNNKNHWKVSIMFPSGKIIDFSCMADDFCQFFGAMMVKYPVSFCHALETFLHMTLYRYAKVTTWITSKTEYLTHFIHIYSHFNIYHETFDFTTFSPFFFSIVSICSVADATASSYPHQHRVCGQSSYSLDP